MSCIESPLSFKIDQTVESPAPTNNFNIVWFIDWIRILGPRRVATLMWKIVSKLNYKFLVLALKDLWTGLILTLASVSIT